MTGKHIVPRSDISDIDTRLQNEAVLFYEAVAHLLHEDKEFTEFDCCIDTFPEIDPTQKILVIGIFDPVVGANDPPMCWYTYSQVAAIVRVNVNSMRVWVGDWCNTRLYSLEVDLLKNGATIIWKLVKKVLDREYVGL